MKKIKELLKSSPIAMVIAGLLIAGVASAAVITIYKTTTGQTAADVQQSVVFGNEETESAYTVGNSAPVAGNVYYNLVTLKNNASDKSAKVELKTSYVSSEHAGYWQKENGITTSYMHWATPQEILTGERPTAVYNRTGDKRYEVWYKTSAANIHYAYYHKVGSAYQWDGANTDVSAAKDCPFVMKEDGKYYMVNYGDDEKKFDIYTSDDGINWTDQGVIYSYGGTWNKIDNPRILKDDTEYKMYFQMKETADSATSKYYIFLATSNAKSLKEIAYNAAHNTESFSIVSGNQRGGSVLAPRAEGYWDSFRVMQPMVFKPGNEKYLMLYTGYDKYDMKGKIGYAVSSDGKDWTRVNVSEEGYDTTLGTDTWKTSVVNTNGNLKLFYSTGATKIGWTGLTSVVNSSNQMTIQPKEIKPFFIKNDFAINLKPMSYTIKTEVKPVD